MRTSSGRQAKPCTEPSECRSCSGEVLWVVWPRSGRRMPVDAVPDMRPPPKGGDIVLTLHGGDFGALHAEKYDAQKHDFARHRYTVHDCPNRGGR